MEERGTDKQAGVKRSAVSLDAAGDIDRIADDRQLETVFATDVALHDVRGGAPAWRRVLRPDDYTASRRLGRELRTNGSRGVVYPSVREAGGQCVGAMVPKAVGLPRQAGVLRYRWNAVRIDRGFGGAFAECASGRRQLEAVGLGGDRILLGRVGLAGRDGRDIRR